MELFLQMTKVNQIEDTFHASYIVAIMKSIVDDKDISD
jgi:hypothetical protein